MLETPSEVRSCLAYVLLNHRSHRSHRARGGERVGRGMADRFSSAPWFEGWKERPAGADGAEPRVTSPARTWLLATGWRRRGLLSLDEIPALRA